MSRTERFLARRWRSTATLFAIITLFGVASILWARQESADREARHMAAEADLRGSAVSTLATDVRKLRAQLTADGKTPVAPDPSNAIDDLPDRAEVPVPIPGEKGEPGEQGEPGEKGDAGDPAPAITPQPGQSGQPGNDGQPGRDGADGADGVDGVDGSDGQPGRDGTNGADGTDGQPPAGWTYTDPEGVTYTCTRVVGFDPAAPRYECTPNDNPDPQPPGNGTNVLGLALAPERRRF